MMPTSDQIAELIGCENYNKLVAACRRTEQTGRLKFWQESLLGRISEKFNFVPPTTAEGYVTLFSNMNPVEISEPSIEDFEKICGQSLPGGYRGLIAAWAEQSATYYFNDNRASQPEWEGRLWHILSTRQLVNNVNVGGVLKPRYNCLGLFIGAHLEFVGENSNSPDETTWERKGNGFVIGEDNGDFLYLDFEDDGSVWIFYHDGCDARLVAGSFDEWLSKARQA